MRKTVLPGLLMALAVTGLPGAAAAGAPYYSQRDASCHRVATVQYLDCEVTAVFACDAIGGIAAPVYREENYDADGLHLYGLNTPNGTPVFQADQEGRLVIRNNLASLSETPFAKVEKTGQGKFSAKGKMQLMGIEKPIRLSVALKSTGTTVTMAGQSATVLDSTIKLTMPAPMGDIVSIEKTYLLPELGIYISGEATGGTMFKPEDTPHRPMIVQLPGQPGFDTIKPAYCGGSLSLATPITSFDGVPA